MEENNNDKIEFEDYKITIKDEELEGVNIETLKACRDRLNQVINKIENEGE